MSERCCSPTCNRLNARKGESREDVALDYGAFIDALCLIAAFTSADPFVPLWRKLELTLRAKIVPKLGTFDRDQPRCSVVLGSSGGHRESSVVLGSTASYSKALPRATLRGGCSEGDRVQAAAVRRLGAHHHGEPGGAC